MDIQHETRAIKARLEGAGSSVAALCRIAGINQSTWGRWLNGTTDPLASFQRAMDAADELAPVKRKRK